MKHFASILLVDDDAVSNFLTSSLIKKNGIASNIATAKNGEEGLTSFFNLHPEVVLLDLHMPIMDGFDFLKALARKMPDYVNVVKIFILTSSSNPSDINKANEFAIEGYITKPLNAEKISEFFA